VSERVEIADHDFAAGPVDEEVAVTAWLDVVPGARANALRISGLITLCKGVTLGATNALNGDVIVPLDPEPEGEARLEIAYRLGGGPGGMSVRPRHRARRPRQRG
jgi:hypothetical protein